MNTPLEVGSLHCLMKNCIMPLHFEVIGMMRIRTKTLNEPDHYKALCPTCGQHYKVLAPKEDV